MQISRTATQGEGCSGKGPSAVILYDRLETMLAANQLLSRWRPEAGEDVDWDVNAWRFDVLERGQEARCALVDTADAELMIVAFGDTEALRSWPEEWLWRWAAGHRAAEATLGVVLLGQASRSEAKGQVLAPLDRLAGWGQLRILVFDDRPMAGARRSSRCKEAQTPRDFTCTMLGRQSLLTPAATFQKSSEIRR